MQNYVTELQPADVLFGRGSGPNDHEGNVRFRLYVGERKALYMATNHRMTKTRIAREIVDLVRAEHGRFLKKVEAQELQELGLPDGTEIYEIVDDDTIMEKAKQALRQNAAKVRGDWEGVKTQDLPPQAAAQSNVASQQQDTTIVGGLLPQQPAAAVAPSLDSLYDLEPIPLTTAAPTYAVSAPFGLVGVVQQRAPPMVSHHSDHTLPVAWNSEIPSLSASSESIPRHHYQQQNQFQGGIARNPQQQPQQSQYAPDPQSQFRVAQQEQYGHRHAQSAPSIGAHELSNYSMAELPNEDVAFHSRRTSLTMSDLMKDHMRDHGPHNSRMQQSYLRGRPGSPMDDLMDSFSQMRTGAAGGSSEDYDQQRRMMASTETMGTIEPLGSVADMSLGTMGSSTFSLFRGNDSLAVLEDGSGTVSSPSASTNATSGANTLGNSRSSNSNSKGSSHESATSLSFPDALHDSRRKNSSFSASINGMLSEVRRQVDSEFPSAAALPRTGGSTEEAPDKLGMESMGESSISVLNQVFAAAEDDDEDVGQILPPAQQLTGAYQRTQAHHNIYYSDDST